MKKTSTRVDIGEGNIRYRVRLEGEECIEGTAAGRACQLNMLDSLTTTPDLTNCGPVPFQSMKMIHNGRGWVIEMEAVGRG